MMDSHQVRALQLKVQTEEMYGVFSSDRSLLLTGGDGANPKAHIWNIETGACLQVFNGHREPVAALAWAGDRQYLASGAFDRSVRLWDVPSGECLRVFSAHRSYVRSVEFSHSQERILSGSGDGSVRLWESATGKLLQEFQGHTDGVYHAVFDPSQTRILSGGRDHTIRLWEISTGQCLRSIAGAHVQCLAWHSGQRRFLSCAGDIRLWDSQTGECLRVFEGHTDTIRSVAWSHDQRHILSASHDRSVRIWEAESGRCVAVLTGHGECVVNAVWTLAAPAACGRSADMVGTCVDSQSRCHQQLSSARIQCAAGRLLRQNHACAEVGRRRAGIREVST